MDVTSIVSGIFVAVLAALITPEIKKIIKRIRRTEDWKKDSVLFCVYLVVCISFTAISVINRDGRPISFYLPIAVVVESSAAMIVLFISYARSFSVVFSLANELLTRSDKNVCDDVPNK